jgi:hypothetical protein
MKLPALKFDLIRLGEQLAEEDNAAEDLWTWLPSHTVAMKRHGDYATNHRPSTRDIMREAAMYLAHLKHPEVPLEPEEEAWFARCPCGEDCVPHAP